MAFLEYCQMRVKKTGITFWKNIEGVVCIDIIRILQMEQSIQEWISKIYGRQPLKSLKQYGLLKQTIIPFQIF